MSIKKADSAGFCFGVNRAINIVNELLEKGIKVATLGPISTIWKWFTSLKKEDALPLKQLTSLLTIQRL